MRLPPMEYLRMSAAWLQAYYRCLNDFYHIYRILADSAGCASIAQGRAPNYVLMDFVNLGDGLAAVNQLNGLS